jgi:hypothetical protein
MVMEELILTNLKTLFSMNHIHSDQFICILSSIYFYDDNYQFCKKFIWHNKLIKFEFVKEDNKLNVMRKIS